MLSRFDIADEPPVFEARLVPAEPPVTASAAPRRAPPVARPSAPPPPAAPPADPLPESADVLPLGEAEATVPESAAPAEPAPLDMPAPARVEAVAPPPLNPFPRRLDLKFDVHYGLASGEQTLVWVDEGGHYTLTSVASATGLAGLFYRGRFVQTSRGRITPYGLEPEEFWDQRGDKRSSARFDASQGRLTLNPAKGDPRHFAYEGGVQDALSLFFQLALTAPPSGRTQIFQVFNGKKLRTYTYEVRGEVLLDTALGSLRTLHLARTNDEDGRFEAWLAIDRHYLPVRMLRTDDKGNEVELQVKAIAP